MRGRFGSRWVAVAVVALAAAPAAALGEIDLQRTPGEATEERVQRVGSSLLGAVLAWMGEYADGSASETELAALEQEWKEPVECAVPVELSPNAWQETRSELAAAMGVEMAQKEPDRDGWDRPIEVYFDLAALPHRPRLLVRSAGANGTFEGPVYESGTFEEGDAADDVVWAFDGLCRRAAGSSLDEGRSREDLAPDVAAQKQTLATFRNVGVAIFSWLTDQVSEPDYVPEVAEDPEAAPNPCAKLAPAPGGSEVECKASEYYVLLGPDDLVGFDELEQLLHPSDTLYYLDEIPRTDGWGRPYEVYLHRTNLLSERIVALRSAGRDGELEGEVYKIGPFDGSEADRDIVWADGFFVRWPQKEQ